MFRVVRVVDGDTVRLAINGDEENVHLIGIDTPETVHPTRGGEPYGKEASYSRLCQPSHVSTQRALCRFV